jgi:hypothetical protein
MWVFSEKGQPPVGKFRDMRGIRSHFAQLDVRSFCLLSITAVPFRKWKIFSNMKNTLERADGCLFRAVPYSRRHAWMMVTIMSGPKGGVQ